MKQEVPKWHQDHPNVDGYGRHHFAGRIFHYGHVQKLSDYEYEAKGSYTSSTFGTLKEAKTFVEAQVRKFLARTG